MKETKIQKIAVFICSMIVLTVTMILSFKFPKYVILWNGTAYFIGTITWWLNEQINYVEELEELCENWDDNNAFNHAQLSCIRFTVENCDLVAVYSPEMINASDVEKSISEQIFDERIVLMMLPQYQKWLTELQQNSDVQITTRKRGE